MLNKITAISLSLILSFVNVIYCSAFSASSICLMDMSTKKILYENNIFEHRSVASTTKIMTCVIACNSNKMNDIVTVKSEMLDNCEGSLIYLKNGDKISLYNLCVGMMLESGNDAANVIAYYLCGSIDSFSKEMNAYANKLGMKNSHFTTPSGLDYGSPYSCAYDMALLAAFAMSSKTFCDIVSKQSAEISINNSKKTVYNHNKLLNYSSDGDNFIGVKTGFTQKAGRCLVSAKKYNGNVIICVTLNCPDDWNAHIYYTDLCKEKYNLLTVSNKLKLNLVGSNKNYIECKYAKKYCLLGDVEIKEYYYPFVYAPIKKGKILGVAIVYYNDKILERLPIEADEDVNYYGKQ